jgi:multiple sugar transport system permease protein
MKEGFLNGVLAALHLDGLVGAIFGSPMPADWLNNTRTALKAIMLQNIWTTAGYFMLIFLAGLQEIPESLYEAAKVDGASPRETFLKVTLPQLQPATYYVITMGIIGCFQVFDQIYIMTAGGPLKSTLTVAYLLYTEAFKNFEPGYGCAIAFILATIIFVLTTIQKRFFEPEEA